MSRGSSASSPKDFEGVLFVLAVGLTTLAVSVWAGALLATRVSGGSVSGGLVDWIGVTVRLVRDPAHPDRAWGTDASGLPEAPMYWACTAVALTAAAAAVALLARLWSRWSNPPRRRVGSPVDARFAVRRDIRPLVVDSTIPPVGRLLLGRMAPRGPLLATEDRERHPQRGRSQARQGDRGSIALIGPTRSGKTVLASAGIVGWQGPVVALSVKRDLYDTTVSARAQRGEIAVFDPSSVTGLPSGRWSPLKEITTASAALRVGRALAQAIPRAGVQGGGDFWAKHGEAFCSAYIALAGLSQQVTSTSGKPRSPLTVDQLAFWAHMQVGILDPTVNELVRTGLDRKQPLETQLLARHAMTHLMALHREDPRIRGSIFATARLAFEAWLEPAVAHSASDDPRRHYNSPPDDRWDHRPRMIDLAWLMGDKDDGRTNTLYICAPDTEFARLTPVLGGLLGDLREQIHSWDVAGRRLEKPLLLIIDEAGQLELQWLPAAVSTLAGLGAVLVTCWQSRSQITDRYGSLSDAVMSGHRSKVFFSGLDDPSSVDYVTKVAGDARVDQRTWSADARGTWRTISEHPEKEQLLPAHLVRQMLPQEAVLFHGTLPPVHLRAVRWWEDNQLRRLVATDAAGRPAPPKDLDTCPLSDDPSPRPSDEDQAADDDILAHLPKPKQQNAGGERPAENTLQPNHADQPVLPLEGNLPADEEEPREVNRVAGACNRCMTWVEVGGGEVIRFGRRSVLRCFPACSLNGLARVSSAEPRRPT